MAQTPFTRVVTDTDADGHSVVVEQESVPLEVVDGISDSLETATWGADILLVGHDPDRVFSPYERDAWDLEPPPAGAVFRIINFPAHSRVELHRTHTIDVGVVLRGEVW